MKWFRVFPSIIILSVAPAFADTVMPNSVIAGGGRDTGGGSHRMRCTLGQGAVGRIAGLSYRMDIGFWHRHRSVVTGAPDLPAFIWDLQQNHPNPFNPMTHIRYSLPEDSHVSLKVFDLKGRLVRSLVDADQGAGQYTEGWDGRDQGGTAVASGTYLARLESNMGVLTRKMLLTR